MTFKRYGELIGHTPMIELSHLQPRSEVQILAKCEFMNPGFSVKDRMIAHVFERAEAAGDLKPGGSVIAASSGNTGASVAMLAAIRGYRAIIVTSPKCSQEKMDAIRAYGAQLIVTKEGQNYMGLAREMAETNPDLFDVDQYDNPENPKAHYLGLGHEIWEQTEGRITHFTCGGSTGGTISGVARHLKEHKPGVRVVLADPVGSVFYDFYHDGVVPAPEPFRLEGVGKENIPSTIDLELVDDVVRIEDRKAFETCHMLAHKEGLMVGGSSGLNVRSALDLAATVQGSACIVTVLPDSGLKYLSKIYNASWLKDQAGLSPAES